MPLRANRDYPPRAPLGNPLSGDQVTVHQPLPDEPSRDSDHLRDGVFVA